MPTPSAGEAIDLLKQTFAEWREDRAERLAAAFAYYTVFALAPLLLIVIAVAGLVLGREAVQGQVVAQIQGTVGRESAAAIQAALENAYNPAAGLLSAAIGVALLLLAATGLFGSLKDSLNTIWEVKPKPGQGVLAVLRERFMSFTMVLGVGFLLLVSLVLSAATAAVGAYFSSRILPGADILWQVVNFVISFGVVTLLFAMIYKVLPDVQIAWRDVWVGAAATALLFTVGKTLLGLYLGIAGPGSTYGAAGSLLVVLVWVYYSAQILFFGAEFTQVYANRYGTRLAPEPTAVRVTEEEQAQQGTPRAAAVAAAAGADDAGRSGDEPAAGAAGGPAGPPPAGGPSPLRAAVLGAGGLLALLGIWGRRGADRPAGGRGMDREDDGPAVR